MGRPMTALFRGVGITRRFRLPRRSLLEPVESLTALDNVSIEIPTGAKFGVVGESGSGKSTLARILLALDQPTEGEVYFDGRIISGASPGELGDLRRDVQVVLQDPRSSLNPRMRVFEIIAEPLRSLGVAGDERGRVLELLDAVGLSTASMDRYPHQFSGGQRQRIAIARALAPHPRAIIADEPVSALDVSVRAQILNLLQDLVRDFGLTLVMVSHDLSVIRYLCDYTAVMYNGEIVESGPSERVHENPTQDYTRRLLAAIPTMDGSLLERVRAVEGDDREGEHDET